MMNKKVRERINKERELIKGLGSLSCEDLEKVRGFIVCLLSLAESEGSKQMLSPSPGIQGEDSQLFQ